MVALLALFAVLAAASVAAVVSLSRRQAHAQASYVPAPYESYDPSYERAVHDARSVHSASMAGDQYHR